ncbi:MAG: FG-GAP-like repeat-containing protein [Minicystis sp.]
MKLRRVFFGLVLPLALSSTAVAAGHGQNFTFADESFRLPSYPEDDLTSTVDVKLVDVDGDGDLDIFLAQGTATGAGRPNVLLINDGTGFFTDESAARLPPVVQLSSRVDFGDVDGDGDPDVIVSNLGPEQLLINDGDGFFTDESVARLPPPLPFFSDISSEARLADVDGDGDLDILVSNENPFDPSPLHGGQNQLWINDGAGFFTNETAARLPAATDQTGGMAIGDIDGDGDLDIIVGNRGQEVVLVNDGDGFFTDETAARFPVVTDSTRKVELGDVDGDGDLDVLTANSRGEPIRLYLNDGEGVFHEVTFSSAPVVSETNTDLQLVDLDGDGDLDVYVANAGPFISGHGFDGGQNQYFRNNGQGKFSEKTLQHFPAVSDPSTAAAFGDLDGDGDLDLVVGNSGVNGGERVYIQHPKP